MRSLVLLGLLCLSPGLLAADAPRRPRREIGLDEAVALALERNLRLAAERINPKRAATVIVERMAIFDPTAYGDLSGGKQQQQSSTTLSGSRQESASGMLGIATLFPPGTLVDLSLGAGRESNDFPFARINPAYSEEWGLRLTQPLLRGFGVRVNTAGIATARNERHIAQAELRDVALATVADVKKTYWQLVLTIRDRGLLQRSLERARNLQRDVQTRVEAKVLGARDPSVAQADAGVAVRQEEIVVAEDAIRDTEEALKVITDLAADPEVWRVALIPTTEPPTTVPTLDAEQAVETALTRRPDYQQAKLLIENQDIVLYVRRNELLPRVDLTVSAGHTGLGSSWRDADHSLGTLDYYRWGVGVVLEYPLGNRAARSRHRRAALERRQAKLNLRALERQIHLEVRNAVRQVATTVERLRAADVSVRAEQKRVSAEQDSKDVGKATIQDVLDAQADLAEAERRRLRALIGLNRSLVDVERLSGTLLETSNVSFEED